MKSQFYKIFQNIQHFLTHYCKLLFRQPPKLLTLDVTVPNTINTRKFRPVLYLARNTKFHHSISWLTLAITNLCQIVFIFFGARTAVQIVSFKNSPTNYCCFGTSTASPWAKAMFLHMHLF